MHKSLKDIALPITEEEYRNDGNLHYSTLATYERGGFSSIPSLGEKKESPSLTFGSAVDSIITGSMQEFNDRFLVADFPVIEASIINIVKSIFTKYKVPYKRLEDIPDSSIMPITEEESFHLNWKPETRVKVIKEKGEEYYNLLHLAETKTIIDTATYTDVMAAVRALKESEATRWYFAADDPFDDRIERIYQPKFKGIFDGLTYSCMMDLVIVDHVNKIIYPCDLKTSSHYEYDFFRSFLDWNYYIQAAEYAAILRQNLDADPYFKEFEMKPYRFIVVNRKTLNPLVWEWAHTFDDSTVEVKTSKGYPIRMRNFREIGKELSNYLATKQVSPNGIEYQFPNSIETWIKNM